MVFGTIAVSIMLTFSPHSAQQAPAAHAAVLSEAAPLAHGPALTPAAVDPQEASGFASAGQAKSGTQSPDPSSQASSGAAERGQKTGTGEDVSKLPANQPAPRVETWGELDPGKGFLVGRSRFGEISLSGYALSRYINQMPNGQTFTDHLGNEHPVKARNDIFSMRIMVFLMGWLGNPKLIYNITFWTVNTTDQKAIFATIGYQFSRKFSLYAGLTGNPGTRSIMGSHPYWLGTDRVMADEFFRPYFTAAISAQGELVPGLWWNFTLGDNNSILSVKATDLDRKFTAGGNLWWMPTTQEFGPRGGYGDWETHDKLATRFGVGFVNSPENRQTSATTGPSNNTTIRLPDSLNVFDTDSLAPGVTVQSLNYRILEVDAGVKYKGIFVQAEVYNRWLDQFQADGPMPLTGIHDWGFYVQAAFFPIRQKLELYGATSQIFADKSAGFTNCNEYLIGGNFYPFNSRNYRINAQVIDVNRSPVNSTFGYYTGGQKGTTLSVAASIFF